MKETLIVCLLTTHLIVKSQQNRIELVTRPAVHQPPVHEEEDGSKSFVCAICYHRYETPVRKNLGQNFELNLPIVSSGTINFSLQGKYENSLL